MLRLASDADVHGAIVRGLRRRVPDIDIVRVQDALAEGTSDGDILSWAVVENRVVISNDRSTMTSAAWERMSAGKALPGLILTTGEQSIGTAIDDILLIAQCLAEEEM